MIFCQSIVEHLEEQDVEAFTNSVKEYDSICRLDPWYEINFCLSINSANNTEI